MIRLFLFLILANLAFFWWQSQQAEEAPVSVSGPLSVPGAPVTLTLLSEAGTPAAVAPAETAPAPPAVPADAGAANGESAPAAPVTP